MKEVAGELAGIGGEDGFQIADVLEGAAVEELAAGIDGLGEGVGEVVAGAVDAGDALALLQAAIARAPAAEDVEVFQREADGIEARVAGGAGFGFRVQREQIADGFGTANVGLDGGDAMPTARAASSNCSVPPTLMRSNSSQAPVTETFAARWITASCPSHARVATSTIDDVTAHLR